MRGVLRKKTVFLVLVLIAVSVWFVFKIRHGVVEHTSTREVATQFGLALQELQKTPPGIGRVENFLARLKAIDSRKAAPEVQQALRDYIAALQPSLEAAKAGQSIAPYDHAIAQTKQRLVDAVREND